MKAVIVDTVIGAREFLLLNATAFKIFFVGLPDRKKGLEALEDHGPEVAGEFQFPAFRWKEVVGVSPKNHGNLAKLAGENNAQMGGVVVSEDQDRVGIPFRNGFDRSGIIQSAEIVCAGVLALVFEEFGIIAVEQWNVPAERSSELFVSRLLDAEIPKIKDLEL